MAAKQRLRDRKDRLAQMRMYFVEKAVENIDAVRKIKDTRVSEIVSEITILETEKRKLVVAAEKDIEALEKSAIEAAGSIGEFQHLRSVYHKGINKEEKERKFQEQKRIEEENKAKNEVRETEVLNIPTSSHNDGNNNPDGDIDGVSKMSPLQE